MGNLNDQSLQDIWFSPKYQAVRSSCRNYTFPDKFCEYCFKNNTHRSLEQEFASLVDETTLNNQLLNQTLHQIIKLLPHQITQQDIDFLLAQKNKTQERKLSCLLSCLIDLFQNNPPQIIAPNRQVNLISQCNARCVMCMGNFRGEIQDPNNKMPPQLIAKAFSNPQHIVDFYMTGTEFLLYPDWRNVALTLKRQNVKISLSTNGILLTPQNIKFLVDNHIFKNLNISIDAASPQIFESIRRNVKFDSLMQHLTFLFQYLVEKQYPCSVSFSFVLMKRNAHELPKLIDLLTQMVPKTKNNHMRSNVLVQALANRQIPLYNDFYQQEHHQTIPTATLQNIILNTASRVKHVGCYMFYGESIDQFILNGYPFPPFIERINSL
jgi:sulfatase maturation enzyme AslB (radical SAM superfamily)